jgi:hypothetical protein
VFWWVVLRYTHIIPHRGRKKVTWEFTFAEHFKLRYFGILYEETMNKIGKIKNKPNFFMKNTGTEQQETHEWTGKLARILSFFALREKKLEKVPYL